MPESRETEFDAEIQESISTLEEISSNMATDVAILYCPADTVTHPSDQTAEDAAKMPVDPAKIHEDLKKAGYTWYLILCFVVLVQEIKIFAENFCFTHILYSQLMKILVFLFLPL